MINAYCESLGWLFDDLREHFDSTTVAVGSDAPLNDADAWICIRSWEANKSPNIARTVVQIHAMEPRLITGNGRVTADDLSEAGAFSYVHPEQPKILRAMGVDIAKQSLIMPIGAGELFLPRGSMPEIFSVGWIGRDTGPNKDLDLFVSAIRRLASWHRCRVVLLGANLERAAERLAPEVYRLEYHARPAVTWRTYPAIYRSLDAVVITSRSEAGPLPLFEALASGVPVVSTRCGWAPLLIQHGLNGFLIGDSLRHEAIAGYLMEIAEAREQWLSRSRLIAAYVDNWGLNGWIESNLLLAGSLVLDTLM